MSIPLKVYTHTEVEESKKPLPLLMLRAEDAAVCAVTLEGKLLSVLWRICSYTEAGIVFPRSAQYCIEGEGYDTSWAVWDSEGRFVRWAE